MLKTQKSSESWTFGIPTDGKRNLTFHPKIVQSIIREQIPSFEIIFCVEQGTTLPDFYHKPPCRVIHCETKKKAWITRKKNLIAQHAQYDNLCLLHDYIWLGAGWYKSYQNFTCDWDICLNPVLSFGHRFFDWVSYDHPDYGLSGLIPYDNTDCLDKMYVSGSYFCVRREFFLKYPLNENLVWLQEEDVEWSKRIRSFWNLKFNPTAPVHTLKKKP